MTLDDINNGDDQRETIFDDVYIVSVPAKDIFKVLVKKLTVIIITVLFKCRKVSNRLVCQLQHANGGSL